MKLIKNNAVLSFQLDNTAHKMHKHQGKSMPAQFSEAAPPISFTDFERHCAERFSNNFRDTIPDFLGSRSFILRAFEDNNGRLSLASIIKGSGSYE